MNVGFIPCTPYHDMRGLACHANAALFDQHIYRIAEPDGRGYYPCKPDIFAATYEPAE